MLLSSAPMLLVIAHLWLAHHQHLNVWARSAENLLDCLCGGPGCWSSRTLACDVASLQVSLLIAKGWDIAPSKRPCYRRGGPRPKHLDALRHAMIPPTLKVTPKRYIMPVTDALLLLLIQCAAYFNSVCSSDFRRESSTWCCVVLPFQAVICASLERVLFAFSSCSLVFAFRATFALFVVSNTDICLEGKSNFSLLCHRLYRKLMRCLEINLFTRLRWNSALCDCRIS